MKLKQYQIDAFTTRPFEGNPAAVCPLDTWLDDSTLQAIAEENNVSETAFFVPEGKGYRLRWFTPVTEVDLCGHATLASAHVLFEHLRHPSDSVTFHTRSGELTVVRRDALLEMNFPLSTPQPCEAPAALLEGIGIAPVETLAAEDYFLVYPDEATVRGLRPDMPKLREIGLRGVIATAAGDEVDCVSRFFAPKFGVGEDPVTGSAHCQLAPYWADRLGKNLLQARQISKRGGSLICEVKDGRVLISGQAVTFLEGEIQFEL